MGIDDVAAAYRRRKRLGRGAGILLDAYLRRWELLCPIFTFEAQA